MDNTEGQSEVVNNQHYDESVVVNDAEEVASVYSPTPITPSTLGKDQPSFNQRLASPADTMSTLSDTEDASRPATASTKKEKPEKIKGKSSEANKLSFGSNTAQAQQKSVSEGDSEDTESSSSDDNAEALTGSYDPAEFDHLSVSQEIKELFQYISRFTPQNIELEHKLKPFNPDYIPAVGDIDAFLKVPRPDNKTVTLGLTVLDEPSAKQSDPTVLDLLLRSVSKTAGIKAMKVRNIKDADHNSKAIDSWIDSISELHRNNPPPSVHYNKIMPEIDYLMQEWPPEVENSLKRLKLPSADLDCTLQAYSDIVCSILDVPTYNNRIHSLHVVFSLYAAVKALEGQRNSQEHEINELKISKPLDDQLVEG